MKQTYYQTAKENEIIFRNILRDMRDNRNNRPGGIYIPRDLETEADLQEIFTRYSEGVRMGKFTIKEFQRPNQETAIIVFDDIAPLSGGGAELEYSIDINNNIQYRCQRGIWMS